MTSTSTSIGSSLHSQSLTNFETRTSVMMLYKPFGPSSASGLPQVNCSSTRQDCVHMVVNKLMGKHIGTPLPQWSTGSHSEPSWHCPMSTSGRQGLLTLSWLTPKLTSKQTFLCASLLASKSQVTTPGKWLLKLLQNVYGLKDAGRTRYLHLNQGLLDRDFVQSQVDPCIF